MLASDRSSSGREGVLMSGLCAGCVCVCVCPLSVCTRRARRARTFTSDETAVELPAASPGTVTRPVFVSAQGGP